jgi:hypothetical protein
VRETQHGSLNPPKEEQSDISEISKPLLDRLLFSFVQSLALILTEFLENQDEQITNTAEPVPPAFLHLTAKILG